jgi:hypothetical protein
VDAVLIRLIDWRGSKPVQPAGPRIGGNSDLTFLREWSPSIAGGVTVAQFAAPHLRDSVLALKSVGSSCCRDPLC